MSTVPKQFFSSNGSGIRNSQIWNGYRSYGSDETRGDHEEHHSGEQTLPHHIQKRANYLHLTALQVVMAGIIAIYGVVVAVLIAGQLAPAGVGSDYTLYK